MPSSSIVLSRKAEISSANFTKTRQPTPKQSGWINSTTGKRQNVFLILGLNCPFKYNSYFFQYWTYEWLQSVIMSLANHSIQLMTLVIMSIRSWLWVIWDDRCNNKINSISAGTTTSWCSRSSESKLGFNDGDRKSLLGCTYLRSPCVLWTLNTRLQSTVALGSYYPSRSNLYLQFQCSRRLQCTGFGVHMLRVLLNHPDFSSPAGASWKACQILGEHISSASYMVWHRMYSRTTVQAQTSLGFKDSSPAH